MSPGLEQNLSRPCIRPFQAKKCIYFLAIILIHKAHKSACFFLDTPSVQWTFQLPESGTIFSSSTVRKGNSVVPSKNGKQLYITTDDGALHILNLGPKNVESSIVYKPPKINGRYTECRSGVSVAEFTTREDFFVVYAVWDVPEKLGDLNGQVSNEEIRSRIIAVNVDGTLRWTFELEGYTTGTPLIGKDNKTIYVSHNMPWEDNSFRGSVKVFLDNSELNEGVELTASKYYDARTGPYGPLTLRTLSIDGKTRDVIYFSETHADGHVKEGRVYIIRPSASYNMLNGRSDYAYEQLTLSTWAWGTVTRPVVSDNGSFVWLGGRASKVAGWVEENEVGDFVRGNNTAIVPRWEQFIQQNSGDYTQPLLNAGTISSDNKHLFISGASNELFCLDALSGDIVWVDTDGDSSFMTELHLSNPANDIDGGSLYAIDYNGRVRQYTATSGDRNWEFDCSMFTNSKSCLNSVEAEFGVSWNGNMLYYADIFGNIVGLQVGSFPTIAPSASPSSLPTALPSLIPTALPSLAPTALPSTISTVSPSSIPTGTPSPSSMPSFSPVSTPSLSPSGEVSHSPSLDLSSISDFPSLFPSLSSMRYDSISPTLPPLISSVLDGHSSWPTSIPSESLKVTESSKSGTTALAVGGSVGGLILLSLTLFLFFIVMKRKKRDKENASRNAPSSSGPARDSDLKILPTLTIPESDLVDSESETSLPPPPPMQPGEEESIFAMSEVGIICADSDNDSIDFLAKYGFEAAAVPDDFDHNNPDTSNMIIDCEDSACVD